MAHGVYRKLGFVGSWIDDKASRRAGFSKTMQAPVMTIMIREQQDQALRCRFHQTEDIRLHG